MEGTPTPTAEPAATQLTTETPTPVPEEADAGAAEEYSTDVKPVRTFSTVEEALLDSTPEWLRIIHETPSGEFEVYEATAPDGPLEMSIHFLSEGYGSEVTWGIGYPSDWEAALYTLVPNDPAYQTCEMVFITPPSGQPPNYFFHITAMRCPGWGEGHNAKTWAEESHVRAPAGVPSTVWLSSGMAEFNGLTAFEAVTHTNDPFDVKSLEIYSVVGSDAYQVEAAAALNRWEEARPMLEQIAYSFFALDFGVDFPAE